jgi:deoxyribodipyrimidine photo-lyase
MSLLTKVAATALKPVLKNANKRALHWFRADLRIADNTALEAAIANSRELITLFIATPQTWKKHHDSPKKIAFLLENLKTLSISLSQHKIPLFTQEQPRYEDCINALIHFCHTHDVDAVYFNKQYELNEVRRDEIIINALNQIGISCFSFDDQTIIRPGEITTGSGEPYKVFTPFKNAWIKKVTDNIDQYSVNTETNNATDQLNQFCKSTIKDYLHDRDFPALDGTSKLSSALTIGTISARQCLAKIITLTNGQLSNHIKYPGELCWLSELIWRDFYKHIIFFYPDLCRGKPYKPITDKLPWRTDVNLLNAWKEGKTGFPLVDAAMRQLKQTGWMHNRLRMVTAMFFSKTLFLDWRLGEQYFMENLIDGDFSANNGGWQWCASTGTDAVPYFRIFNPTTQSERFDPEGTFIRQYCPELSKLDNKKIHDPYSRGASHIDYPKPIVDYKAMRQYVIEQFKKAQIV